MKTNRKPKILRVWIEHRTDVDPDTSHLGEYSNTPTEIAVDRKERGDMGRGEYRYFNPAMSGEETGNPDSPEQDYQRMEALQRGDWAYIGVIAKAEVQLTSDLVQVLRSGGLWGVESDSGADYLKEVADEELCSLRTELEAVGFGRRAIAKAFANVQACEK
jgi:hypothetical protein